MSAYIPKSVFVWLLFGAAALAGALGWALNGSANEVAGASSAAPAVLQEVSAAATTPVSTSPPVSTGYVPGTGTSLTAGPGALSGVASTVRTTTALEVTPTGTIVGVAAADPASALRGVEVPAVPTGPVGPAGPTGPTIAGLGQPAATPSAYAPAAPSPVPAIEAWQQTPTTPLTIKAPHSYWDPATQGLALEIPPTFAEQLFYPLPGAQSRGVSFSEWESYRTDVAGRNILVTTDDSNYFKDRNGKLNGNTGDTDASGLNVTDATDSVIRGTESADAPPWEAVVQGIVDIATATPTDLVGTNPALDDNGDSNAPAPAPAPIASLTAGTTATSGQDALGDTNTGDIPPTNKAPASLTKPAATITKPAPPKTQDAGDLSASKAPAAPNAALKATRATPVATAAVIPTPAETDAYGGSDSSNGGYDFPYVSWVNAINSQSASAVHTDEGTTLASGQDALVIGADGYDDDDNRAAGENITITRDDDNVVVGGTGDVNAQIGDSEQGAVIMGVTRSFIQGGGAY